MLAVEVPNKHTGIASAGGLGACPSELFPIHQSGAQYSIAFSLYPIKHLQTRGWAGIKLNAGE